MRVLFVTGSICALTVFGLCGVIAIGTTLAYRTAYPGVGFYGKAVDVNGQPVGGADVRLIASWTNAWGDGPSGHSETFDVISDPNGRFTFDRRYETVRVASITKATQVYRGNSNSPRTYVLPAGTRKDRPANSTTFDRPAIFTMDTGYTFYSIAK